MDYKEKIDILLDQIKTSHFQTIHKLSSLYKDTEKMLTDLKNKSNDEIEKGLLEVKELLSKTNEIKIGQVDNLKNDMKNMLEENMKEETKDSSSELVDSIIPAFNLDNEDKEKLYEITQTNMSTMYGLFQRMSEIFIEHAEEKSQKEDNQTQEENNSNSSPETKDKKSEDTKSEEEK